VTEHVGFSYASSRLEDVLDVVSAFPTSPWSITCGVDNVLVSMQPGSSVKYYIMYWCPCSAASIHAIGMGLPAVRGITSEFRQCLYTYQRLLRGKLLECGKCVECSTAHNIYIALDMQSGTSSSRHPTVCITRAARIVL